MQTGKAWTSASTGIKAK